MKKIFTFVALLCLGIVATSCKKDKGEEPTVNPADYQLSADGKTLIKWLNPETTSLNMQDDVNLRQVTTIEKEVFRAHLKLSELVLPEKLEIIKESAFTRAGLNGELVIPKNVKKIESEAFSGTKISSLIFKSYPVELGRSVFSWCNKLKTVVFDKGLSEGLPDATFHSCVELESINFNKNLPSIGEYAFSRCLSLKRIELGAGTEKISDGAFAYCENLRSITLPLWRGGQIPQLGNDIFFGLKNNQIPNIYVTSSLVDLFKLDESWKIYADKIFPMP